MMNRFLVILCLAPLLGSPLYAVATTQNRTLKPLLLPGKRSLYQRILTLPDAQLYPHETLILENPIKLPPFSPYYVYDRITHDKHHEWLRIGLDRKGDVVGWISSDKTMEWNHGLTLSFRKPATEQDRVLLFQDKESVKELAETYDLDRYERLYVAAKKGIAMSDSPVVAIQPDKDIDIRKNFYLLPIHDFEEIYLDNSTARLLKVTSVSLKHQKPEHKQSAKADPNLASSANIVFVIDSTLSMGPYIERVQQAVKKVYDSLKQKALLGTVRFGLIAFRDNPGAAPSIEYLTRRYVTLKQGVNASSFMQSVEYLRPALHSSKDFIEDSYAGVLSAITEMDWSPDAARYIVLITDAGARDENDPLASTGLNSKQLNQLALDNNTAVFVLHLLTPDPKADHKRAATQYHQLSHFPDIGNLYYGVPTGNLHEFGEVVDSLAGQITNQVTQSDIIAKKPASKNTQLTELQAKITQLGHALRMRYLSTAKDGEVPDVFNAWLLDKDFRKPEKPAVDVRVLLTRDQLSDLYSILKKVMETAEQGLISPHGFLDELKSLAATIARDPQQLGGTTATTSGKGLSLAELGFVREYIEDLPYTGEVTDLSLQDWQSWSVSRQVGFLQQLEEKIAYYQALHDHVDLWVSLSGGPINGDSVFPVPLEMLP